MLTEYKLTGDNGELLNKVDYSVIRKVYRYTYRNIENCNQLKATLRNGQWAWPGGYPLYFICSDGAALSFDSVKKELRNILHSIKYDYNDGWRVVACDINYENNELYCDHSGEKIEAAYRE